MPSPFVDALFRIVHEFSKEIEAEEKRERDAITNLEEYEFRTLQLGLRVLNKEVKEHLRSNPPSDGEHRPFRRWSKERIIDARFNPNDPDLPMNLARRSFKMFEDGLGRVPATTDTFPFKPPEASESVFLYRGDNRPPSEIFRVGFDARITGADSTYRLDTGSGPYPARVFRPDLRARAILDVDSQYTPCFSTFLNAACLFPFTHEGESFLYAVYVPTQFIFNTYTLQVAIARSMTTLIENLQKIIIDHPEINPILEEGWQYLDSQHYKVSRSNPLLSRLDILHSYLIARRNTGKYIIEDEAIRDEISFIIRAIVLSLRTSVVLFTEEVCTVIPVSETYVAYAVKLSKTQTRIYDDGFSVKVRFEEIIYNEGFKYGRKQALCASVPPLPGERTFEFRRLNPVLRKIETTLKMR